MQKNYLGDLFLTKRFYSGAIVCAIVFVLAYLLPALWTPAQVILFVFLALTLIDFGLLFYGDRGLSAERKLSARMSNGFENLISLTVKNGYGFAVDADVIDELPMQLQERNFTVSRKLGPAQSKNIRYKIKPSERGEYAYGDILLYASTVLKLVQRRFRVGAAADFKVYPSFQNLGTKQLMAEANDALGGNRRFRKIGQSMEFEQIKEYVSGDDIRTINWKATARRGNLMINSFTEEKSQQIYAVIDKGRVMKMPFNNLSLLDYAINSTLALANLSLQKQDKFGLLTFSNKIDTVIAADKKLSQRETIMHALYKEQTAFKESDYEGLYLQIRKKIRQRSLLILFTNFESVSGMERQLSYLRSIARYHYLLVVFFENTELVEVSQLEAEDLSDIYVKAIAGKFVHEKKSIVRELQQHGISSLLTRPEQLTVHLLNKYLELKARQVV